MKTCEKIVQNPTLLQEGFVENSLILEEYLVLYRDKESTEIMDGLHNVLKDSSKYHVSN